jgi:uncharacterized protein YhaN
LWKRLVLRGFGCYAGEKELDLREGLNVVIGPNEHGKSTLVAGLIAVLYGLPGSTDPAKFGKARYRNWAGAGAFTGQLEFQSDGELYRVTRDFDTDRISFARQGSGGWQELARGEHRRLARRQNVSYLELVRQLVGIESADLFTATFCIRQPLPDQDQLDAALVQLLSGATGSYQEGLEQLGLAVRVLTRYTGERGVTERNQRQDQRLEKLQSDAEALGEQIQRYRQLLDALPAVQEELARAGQEQQELSGRLQQAEQSLRAWSEWREHRTRYDTCRHEQARLTETWERAYRLARQEAELGSSLKDQYGDILACPPHTGDQLIFLQGQAAQRAQRVAELEACVKEQLGHAQVRDRLEELIKTSLAPVAGRPALPGKHRELVTRLEERDRLSKEMTAAHGRTVWARARLDGMPDWSQLGPAPSTVAAERWRASDALRAWWREYLGYRQEREDIAAELKGELDWFNTASDEARQASAQGASLRDRLAYRLEQAGSAWERARARLDAYHAAQKAYEAEFGPLAGLGDAEARAMDQKLALVTQRQEVEKTGGQATTRLKQLLILGVAGLIAVVLFSAGHRFWAAAVPVAAVAWLAGARRARYRRQLAAIARDLAGLERKHPFLASWDARELIRAKERYLWSRAQAERLSVQYAGLPQAGELMALEQELAASQAAARSYDELTAGARARYADPASAFARWDRLRQRREELERSILAWRERQLGARMRDPGEFPVAEAPGAWKELASLAQMAGVTVETVAALANWLDGLDSGWWQETIARARDWEEARDELRAAKSAEQALTAVDGEGMTAASRLELVIARLSREVAPFDGTHRTEDVQQQVNECQGAETDLHAARLLYQKCDQEGQRLQDEIRELTAQITAHSAGLEPLLAGAAGDYGRALERWRLFSRERERKDRISADLQAVLKGQGATTLEELRLKVMHAQNQAGVALARWQDLVSQHPGLPGTDLNEDAEARYRALQKEVNDLAGQRELSRQRVDRLRGRQAELVGASPGNLAEAEVQLQEVLAELDNVKLEVEALTLAHHTLKAAAQDFQTSHRQRLAAAVTGQFAALSGVRERRVEVDEEFCIGVLLEDGQKVRADQLSQGARDQLFLALRLAIADLLSGDYILPLILDDPLLHFDSGRLELAREAIQRLARRRQVLLFSHRHEFAGWSGQ